MEGDLDSGMAVVDLNSISEGFETDIQRQLRALDEFIDAAQSEGFEYARFAAITLADIREGLEVLEDWLESKREGKGFRLGRWGEPLIDGGGFEDEEFE